MDKSIFKAYDIRGTYPEQVNEATAYCIGVAYAKYLGAKKVVVGKDVRESGPSLIVALIAGLQSEGVEVYRLPENITTELIYFAAAGSFLGLPGLKFDGGIAVTAWHNPREYNGFKMCRGDASPIAGGDGMEELAEIAQGVVVPERFETSETKELDITEAYFDFLKERFITSPIGQFKIVANSNFGMQASYLKRLIEHLKLPIEVTYLNDIPNGSFPKGRPDPMIPSNREETSQMTKAVGADFGAAWDSDADRCFFYDHEGRFIDPYYINAMLIDFLLTKDPTKKVFHDMRLYWAISDMAKKHNAESQVVIDKAGNSYVKMRMRNDGLDFGAEITAHYFFKDFFYADSGLIPFLWMLQILTEKQASLDSVVSVLAAKYPKVGELLFKVPSVSEILAAIREKYIDGNFDGRDGVSYEFGEFRFNARGSNTEPLLKLNVEARDPAVAEAKASELTEFIVSLGGEPVLS